MLEEYTKDLSLDALLFFATHALVVVVLCAAVFFSMGLLVGYFTWAKFKRRSRAYFEELQIQRAEIAKLKRRLVHGGVEASEPVDDVVSPVLVDDLKIPVVDLIGPRTQPLSAATSTLAAAVLRQVREAPVPAEMVAKQPSTAPIVSEKSVAEPASEVTNQSDEAVGEESLLESTPAIVTAADQTDVATKKTEDVAPIQKDLQTEQVGRVAAEPITKGFARHLIKGSDAVSRPTAALAPIAIDGDRSSGANGDIDQALRSGQASIDQRLGMVYHQRPERFDDLTLLRGVGEALQTKLRELGIYTFRQIANWNDDQIHEFDARLIAKDRIRREQWVRQARNLHFLKYGEQLRNPASSPGNAAAQPAVVA